MRRPARRLFTLCSAASLLLALAACMLWVRSYFACDVLQRTSTQRYMFTVRNHPGYLWIELHGPTPAKPHGWHQRSTRTSDWDQQVVDNLRPPLARAGVSLYWQDLSIVGWDRRRRWVHTRIVRVRHCVIVIAGSILPIWYAYGCLRHRRSVRQNLCPGCGYDLRATPGRCPECGTVAAAAAANAEAPAAPPG